jgi:Skp family chaperone for outer membrane proteins
MRKLTVLIALLAVVFISTGNFSAVTAAENKTGLKTGYVDLELVLRNFDAYIEARGELEALNEQFQEKMEKKKGEIEELRSKLQQSDMLGQRSKQQLQQELIQKGQQFQREVRAGQRRLETKQEELLGPVRDVVQVAVGEVALERDLDIVHRYDIENATVLWVSEEHEISEQVIDKLEENQQSEE